MQGQPLVIRLAILGGPLLLVAVGAAMPGLIFLVLPVLAAVAGALLLWEFPLVVVALVLATLPMGLELNLGINSNTVVAGQKAGLIFASAVCIVRRGFSGQFNGPALAFIGSAFVAPLLGQLHPGNTPGDLVRSMIGTLSPFAILWVRLDRRWCERIILLVVLSPLIAIACGLPLAAVGMRPMLASDQTGVIRLQGSTIAAFVGYFGTIATMAAFAEYVLSGRQRWLALTAAAGLCVVASGTRVPTLSAFLFCLLVLCFARGRTFNVSRRGQLWMLGGAAVTLGGMVVLPSFIRRSLSGPGGGIQASGRDVIWPIYARAIEQFPLFGQGIGTYRVLVDPDDVRYLGTLAAHNEYLRLGADIGIVGVVTVVLGHAALLVRAWRLFNQPEQVVMRAFSLVLAIYSLTDNTLIATPAMTLYAWVAAFIERARRRAEDEQLVRPRRAPLSRA
jgi:O-antigen ligase